MNAVILSIYCAAGLLMTRCSNPPKPFTEKRIVLANKQTIRIEELEMTITNRGCSRKWMTDNGGEKPYCDLQVKVDDSVYQFGDSFAPLFIRNFKLEIDKMNPMGREEDSVPPGGCRVIVKRLPDLSR